MPHRTLQLTGRLGLFAARHLLAAAVLAVATALLWTIVYLILLFWAIATNAGLGGPLAYPVGLVGLVLAALVASLLVFLPTTSLAEWLARRLKLPILTQIPLALGALAIVCVLAAAASALAATPPKPATIALTAAIMFVSQLLPLGLYWWTAQCPAIMMALVACLRRKLAGIAHAS